MLCVFFLGIGWIPPQRCCHPEHIQAIGKKSPSVVTVPISLSQTVTNRYKSNVPIGSVFCHNHIKKERLKLKNNEEVNVNDVNIETEADTNYVPD